MRHRILVAEDSHTQAQRLRLVLEDAGYEVELAANGREGVDRAWNVRPDLIISDVVMPEMDGFAFCEVVKSDLELRRIPFALLTGQRTPGDIMRGIEVGADNFIPKPFEDAHLLARIGRIFENLDRRRRGGLEMELTVRVAGREIVVNADKEQMIELLFTTSEELSEANLRLEEARLMLEEQARELERRVVERTAELRMAEERLHQSQKLEAVGQLAGGIAHDFNNMLGVITGYGELALRQLEPDHPASSRIDQMVKAAERAAGLTRQILAFSRKQVLQPRILDLNAALAELDKMLHRVIGEHVELQVRAAPGLAPVMADPTQIGQVVINLAVNARDAMPKGGQLTIETANVEFDEAYAATHPPARPGPHVMLAISDTGVGMDAETQRHIFEPFFTTKPAGEGTGLGLATVYGIVKQSGGYIWVYSEPGRGTTFKIYLPRSEEAPVAPSVDAAPVEAPRGHETVLLVEDLESLRGVIREFLEQQGYTLLIASQGEEALALAREYDGPIHLLLTDLVMPKLGGADLARQLGALRPEIRVLYMSGYTNGVVSRPGVLKGGAALIEKPFTGERLARAVREALGRPRAESP